MIAPAGLGRLGRAPGHSAPPRPRPPAKPPRDGRRRLTVPPSRRRLLAGAVALIALLAGAWLWLRDSSLVAVRHVSVSVQSGPEAQRIRSSLLAAARTMTTLDVRMGELRTAVAPYPVVKDLRVSPQFPHGMQIRVVEQVPVAQLSARGRPVALVASDGTILHDGAPAGTLPVIAVAAPPGGSRVSDHDALSAAALLGAAPYELLARVAQVSTVASHGLVAQLRAGPSIYFGDNTTPRAKWLAALAVLADSGSAGAGYVDVTDPGRPAAGVASSGGSASALAAATPAQAPSLAIASPSASSSPPVPASPPAPASGSPSAPPSTGSPPSVPGGPGGGG